MPDRWINAVVTVLIPMDLPIRASMEERQEAVGELVDEHFGPHIRNNWALIATTEIVVDGDQHHVALAEAAMLLETAEQDGYVSAGWREDARTWRACWSDVLTSASGRDRT